jgi:hypothetical protein
LPDVNRMPDVGKAPTAEIRVLVLAGKLSEGI